jgi:hypothetical protein
MRVNGISEEKHFNRAQNKIVRVTELLVVYKCRILCCIAASVVVSMLACGTQVRGFKPRPKPSNFSCEKNPQHAFLRRGSKAVCPIS